MAELLTTKQLQEILQVDRTTIYRMADGGRLPGIKVGNQWRFPRQQIETWLQSQSGTVPITAKTTDNGGPPSPGKAPISPDLKEIFPLECIQLIQDGFAESLNVMILVTDMEGNLITTPSNACGLYLAAITSPIAQKLCEEQWIKLANDPTLSPRFYETHLGLLCARGLIRVGSEIKAMLVVGGIAPSNWPPSDAKRMDMAAKLELDDDILKQHINSVHFLTHEEQAKVLPFVQRIADIFAHVATERMELFDRLQRIAAITQM